MGIFSFGGESGVKVGEKLPSFELLDSLGKRINSSDLSKPVVIFFYPKNETAVCTKEACHFRDYYKEFREKGVEVIGVSKDSPESHGSFKSAHQLPYPLYTDEKGDALEKLGFSKTLGVISARVTLVINKEGEIIHIFNSQIQAEQHVTTALKSLGIE